MCVDDVVRLGWSFGEGANFILAEGLKIEFFWHYQVEKAVWYQPFANLVYTWTLPIRLSTWLGDL